MKRQYMRGYVQRDESKKDGPLRIVAATEGMKGDGLNLTMDSAQLERFQANPIVGYGHAYWGRENLPIGRAEDTFIEDDKLKMDITFDPDDAFAQQVDRKYRAGIMNAFSIGFSVWNVDDETGIPEGWELFEVSAVPLPMDPDAVVEDGREVALAREIRDTRMTPQEFAEGVMAAMAALANELQPASEDSDARERLLRARGRLTN